MSDKKAILINILQKSAAPVTGKQLAKEMNCTTRTIINYVNQINASKEIIRSSQEGYSLLTDSYQTQSATNLPQDRSARMFYILRRLLLSGQKGIDGFDLADELMISYSLLKKEISEFNVNLKPFEVSIISRNNSIMLEGKERNKRKVMTAFIHKMEGDNFLDIEKLKEVFGQKMVESIQSIILDNVNRFNGYVNDFSMLNLILHLSIIVNRLKAGEILEDAFNNEATIIKNTIADHIIREVEHQNNVLLDESEYQQMTALINAHVHLDSDTSDKSSEKGTNSEQYQFVKDLLEEVKTVYYLDFTDTNFLIPFSLHIQNLIIRLQNNIQIDNPIKETIRDTAPFLYDIAVFIMQSVCQHYGITAEVSDNEFTFIVMHLALEVERQKQNDSYVKALLYLPKYLGLEKDLPNKIISRFEEIAKFVAVVSFEEEIGKYDYDVLISFVNVSLPINKRFVKINPILKQSDYANLSDTFTYFQQEKLITNFKNVFPFFFEKDNFIIEKEKMDKFVAISKISQLLKKNGYVNEKFEDKVIEREKAISTGYLNFAVPHGVTHSTLTQTVGVMIIPEGMLWDNRIIYCVLLMAVNPETLTQFQDMYNALLLMLMETDCVEKIKDAKDFDEFRNILLNTNVEL